MTDTDLPLHEGWTLLHPARDIALPVSVPFDVHSRLIESGIIGDPYWRDRELELDWVHEEEWTLVRQVEIEQHELTGHWTLSLARLDCCTSVRVNDTVVGKTASQFVRHDLDIGAALVAGENRIEITFHSNSRRAAEAAEAFPFELPYLDWNCRIGHTNHLRTNACHAGWDWNIALMPLGIHGSVRLRRNAAVRLDEIKVVQHHVGDREAGRVRVCVSAYAHGFAVAETELSVSFHGQRIAHPVRILPGENRLEVAFDLDAPELWWPAGYGAQPLHTLVVSLDGQQIRRQVGLREVRLLTTPDRIGARFAIAVNGCEIFMRGANWIPADALPERCTPAVMEGLLGAARDAHMNMLRVWGGGQYEPDGFYDLCDRLGILVWQDFMFACNHYPAANPAWLALVRREAHQQVRRLSSHACVALWCGDNELVGALNWFEVTRANRDRYLANYVILNHALEEVVTAEAIDIPFWPSSPSSGRLDFGDAWHDDRSGDMHFWDVWHSAKEFEHYRSVRPRFCSEFGFQSFPSLTAIERFTEPEDRNVSSPIMDIHQRNDGGNGRIVETIARYFRFPDGFEEMVYLSQVSQGLAMQTAIEFWRSQKPRCMGTLYWQLNDTWPVASWASLEHGGAWKVCHSMARRFYAPVLCTVQPDAATGEAVVWAIADTPDGANLTLDLSIEGFDGSRTGHGTHGVVVPPDRAVEVVRLPAGAVPEQAFLHLHWHDAGQRHVGENVWFPKRFKAYSLPEAQVTARWREVDGERVLELQTDAPALYVSVGLGDTTVWSDNAFTLLPGRAKRIRALHAAEDRDAPLAPVQELPSIQYLGSPSAADASGHPETTPR